MRARRASTSFAVDNVAQLLTQCPNEIRVRLVRGLIDVLVSVEVIEASGPAVVHSIVDDSDTILHRNDISNDL